MFNICYNLKLLNSIYVNIKYIFNILYIYIYKLGLLPSCGVQASH